MKKPKKSDKRTGSNFDSSLGPMNIEPPKVYREGQRLPSDERRRHKKTSKSEKSGHHGLSNPEMRSRQNKKRKLKNSVRNAIVFTLLILVFAAVGVVLSLTVFFKIDTISVTGSGIYSEEEIINACNINNGDNLFLIDKEKSTEKMECVLPYIYTAEIKRELPSTVKIIVTDAVPAFSIQKDDESFILLDDNFKVLENSAAENSTGTVMITNAKVADANNGYEISFENAQIADCLVKLAEGIKDVSMSEATAMYSNGLNDNYIVYEGRIIFKLGSCDDLENKLYRGLASCEELSKSNDKVKGTLNLSAGKQSYFTEE